MKARDLTIEQLKALIEKTVEEKLRELLGDPDEGLELKDEVRLRLQESLSAMERGEKGIPIGQAPRCWLMRPAILGGSQGVGITYEAPWRRTAELEKHTLHQRR